MFCLLCCFHQVHAMPYADVLPGCPCRKQQFRGNGISFWRKEQKFLCRVIRKGPAVLKLLASEDEALLIRGNSFLVLERPCLSLLSSHYISFTFFTPHGLPQKLVAGPLLLHPSHNKTRGQIPWFGNLHASASYPLHIPERTYDVLAMLFLAQVGCLRLLYVIWKILLHILFIFLIISTAKLRSKVRFWSIEAGCTDDQIALLAGVQTASHLPTNITGSC